MLTVLVKDRQCVATEDLIGIGNCILGYEAETPAEKPRKEGRVLFVGEKE